MSAVAVGGAVGITDTQYFSNNEVAKVPVSLVLGVWEEVGFRV